MPVKTGRRNTTTSEQKNATHKSRWHFLSFDIIIYFLRLFLFSVLGGFAPAQLFTGISFPITTPSSTSLKSICFFSRFADTTFTLTSPPNW